MRPTSDEDFRIESTRVFIAALYILMHVDFHYEPNIRNSTLIYLLSMMVCNENVLVDRSDSDESRMYGRS